MKEVQMMSRKRQGIAWKIVIGLVVVGIAVGAVFGYRLWTQQTLANTAKSTSAYSTTAVRKGSISVSVTGSGTNMTDQSADLAFSTAGTVAELDVQVGDSVTKGQVLARIQGTQQLELAVENEQLALGTAQKALDDLTNNATLNKAQAAVDQVTAAQAVETAQANLLSKSSPTCQAGETQDYYTSYRYNESEIGRLKGLLETIKGTDRLVTLQELYSRQKLYEAAYANYLYCVSGPTDSLIAQSQANVDLARANLKLANDKVAALNTNNGIDPVELAKGQATLKNAQQALAKAKEDLAGTTLTAPMDGVVSAVNGSLGAMASTSTFITVKDLTHPQVQVNIDEADLANIAVGCSANVTFDALSGQNFPGTVTQVSPSLVTVSSVGVVQGLVELQKKQTRSGKALPLGLTATVEVTCSQASDVLLAPAQALYQDAGLKTTYMYVLDAQGKPEKRTVETGLKTVALVEIRSGLKEGDRVITSQVQGS